MYPHRHRPFRLSVCLLVMIGVSVLIGHHAAAQPLPTPTGTDVSQAQIADLIRLLEDDTARTAFLEHLKALAHLQAPASAAKPEAGQGLLAGVILGIERTVQQTLAMSTDLFGWLLQAPRLIADLGAWLVAPGTLRFWGRTLTYLAVSLVPALLLLLVLRRVLRPLSGFTLPPRVWPVGQQLWQALLTIIARVTPVVAGVIVALVLLGVSNAPAVVQERARFLLIVALYYYAISQAIWVILAPEPSTERLFPLLDETATYLWIWARRFLLYGVAYVLIMRLLQGNYAEPQAYQGVRGLLLIVFPTLVTVFVAQIARQRIRRLTVDTLPAGERVLHTARRVMHTLWPFLVVGYAWVLTVFMISHHAGGVSYLLRASVKTLLVALGLLLVLRLFNRLFTAAFRISDRLRQRYPLIEERANRYLTILQDICNGLLGLLAVGMVLECWGVPASWFLTSPIGIEILTRTLVIALAVGLTGVAMGLSKAVGDRLLRTRMDAQGVVHEPNRKLRTLVPLVHTVLKVALLFVAALIILEQLNVNTGPVLAGVGILGLAVGFGAQSLVKDVINGLFILFEDSVSVGDVAVLRGTGGLVEKVTLRTVTLRDLSGNVHVIPNSSIDMVSNMTKEYSRYLLEVGVAYRENVDEVIDILREIDADLRADAEFGKDMLEPIEIMGLDRFADSAVIIRARLKTRPIQQWRIGREFNRRMKKVFDARDIEIPFPHHTVYWGLPKQGTQEPIHLAMNGDPQAPGQQEE